MGNHMHLNHINYVHLKIYSKYANKNSQMIYPLKVKKILHESQNLKPKKSKEQVNKRAHPWACSSLCPIFSVMHLAFCGVLLVSDLESKF